MFALSSDGSTSASRASRHVEDERHCIDRIHPIEFVPGALAGDFRRIMKVLIFPLGNSVASLGSIHQSENGGTNVSH